MSNPKDIIPAAVPAPPDSALALADKAPPSWSDVLLHIFDGIASQSTGTQIAWMVFWLMAIIALIFGYRVYQKGKEREKEPDTVPLALADKLITGLGEQQRDLLNAHKELTATVSRAVEQTTATSKTVDSVGRQVETLYHSHITLGKMIAEHGEKLEDHTDKVSILARQVEEQGSSLEEQGRKIVALARMVGSCPTNCANQAAQPRTLSFVPADDDGMR